MAIYPAKKVVILLVRDNGETVSLFEPLIVPEGSKYRAELTDLAVELSMASEGFKRSLPPYIASSLADLVRSMNCYYSNLIEGHNTHPIDIEKALNNDYSADLKKRNLQLEAKAHITVQQWIDDGGIEGRSATHPDVICEIHRRFCELLPSELLIVTNPETGREIIMKPGELRDEDVKVGRHIAVSPGAVPRFLERMDNVYKATGRADYILAAACAHHRLLWVHPFLDGNGRVARLMSYSMLDASLKPQGLWSVARGFARQQADYKQHLAACDAERRNDLDGRGTLSEEALAEFVRFFLTTCIDQVRFMEQLMTPDQLRNRIMIWAEEQIRSDLLPAHADSVLRAVLYQGELPRADVDSLLGMSERSARRVTAALLESGALTSDSPRAPLRLAFPAKFADRWMPGLFPGQ